MRSVGLYSRNNQFEVKSQSLQKPVWEVSEYVKRDLAGYGSSGASDSYGSPGGGGSSADDGYGAPGGGFGGGASSAGPTAQSPRRSSSLSPSAPISST